MSAELTARRTAAAAVLADFRAAERNLHDRPAYPAWALRLADMLTYLLAELDAEAARPADVPPPGEPAAMQQLADIRLVLDAFCWETDDRQYALEQIDDIVNRGAL